MDVVALLMKLSFHTQVTFGEVSLKAEVFWSSPAKSTKVTTTKVSSNRA
jgi:hypothetical protein